MKKFRLASAKDIDRLKEIFYQNYFTNGGHLASKKSMPQLGNIENCFVVLEDDNVVGYAQIYLEIPKEDLHIMHENIIF